MPEPSGADMDAIGRTGGPRQLRGSDVPALPAAIGRPAAAGADTFAASPGPPFDLPRG